MGVRHRPELFQANQAYGHPTYKALRTPRQAAQVPGLSGSIRPSAGGDRRTLQHVPSTPLSGWWTGINVPGFTSLMKKDIFTYNDIFTIKHSDVDVIMSLFLLPQGRDTGGPTGKAPHSHRLCPRTRAAPSSQSFLYSSALFSFSFNISPVSCNYK